MRIIFDLERRETVISRSCRKLLLRFLNIDERIFRGGFAVAAAAIRAARRRFCRKRFRFFQNILSDIKTGK
jgi:hypothetical protein